MTGYTIVNLKEVEDQAPNFGLAPDFEARFARVALEAELVGLTYQRLAPNLTVPWGHTHKTQEEVFLVLEGSVEVKVPDGIHELRSEEHTSELQSLRQLVCRLLLEKNKPA